ncbi:hypothetical protein [Nocardia sp. NPDC049149]|uniref:hypothetical protein n=1 Tax=Nocardia sp. NPDC049149 TaxID=3364315 RepID=UPI0037144056
MSDGPAGSNSVPGERVLRIREISARTGDSPDRIRHLRVVGHELYSRAWKSGLAKNSPLKLEASAVDAWVAQQKRSTSRDAS